MVRCHDPPFQDRLFCNLPSKIRRRREELRRPNLAVSDPGQLLQESRVRFQAQLCGELPAVFLPLNDGVGPVPGPGQLFLELLYFRLAGLLSGGHFIL